MHAMNPAVMRSAIHCSVTLPRALYSAIYVAPVYADKTPSAQGSSQSSACALRLLTTVLLIPPKFKRSDLTITRPTRSQTYVQLPFCIPCVFCGPIGWRLVWLLTRAPHPDIGVIASQQQQRVSASAQEPVFCESAGECHGTCRF